MRQTRWLFTFWFLLQGRTPEGSAGIDFGSGEILKRLNEIGVGQVDWILHTHFHREQSQGDRLARSNEFFALTDDVPVDRSLKPGTTFDWGGLHFRDIGSPRHTEGSLSFLLESADKRQALCGDLVASPGKLITIHGLKWPYVGGRGIAAEIGSLNMMRQHVLDLRLPSHGERDSDVQHTIPRLISDLDIIYDEYNWYTCTARQPFPGVMQMSPHVWHVGTQRVGTAYVTQSAADAAIRIPDSAQKNRRYVIRFDVSRDGEWLGEIAETVISMLPRRAH